MKFFRFIGRKIANAFHFMAYCLLYFICKVFMPNKVYGKENIKENDEARVFLSNHLELYGPIVMHVHFPIKKKAIWIHEYMLNKDKIEEQMAYGFVELHFKWIPKFIKRAIVKIFKHFLLYVLKNKVNGISVSRENSRDLVATMKNTYQKIEEGNSIIIFPEKLYQNEGVGELLAGFTTIAKYVYKKSGKKVSFYPVYIDKKHGKTHIGNPIKYDPTDEYYSDNITEYIYTAINKLSAKSQKMGKVVPEVGN